MKISDLYFSFLLLLFRQVGYILQYVFGDHPL